MKTQRAVDSGLRNLTVYWELRLQKHRIDQSGRISIL